MVHVFIDTNIYLEFFRFAKDNLEELRKLVAAISGGEIKLWTTDQVRDELERNRAQVVSESIASVRKLGSTGGAPLMAQELEEFVALRDARRELGHAINAVTERLTSQFADRSLAADQTLDALMGAAENIAVTPAILDTARARKDRGNPPGKKQTLGDEINWEGLLAALPAGAELCIVTEDGDFKSKMDAEVISPFLAREWRDGKGGTVHLHSQISSLLQARFPGIELATEVEKEARIRRLVESGSFQRTHDAIEKLGMYLDFTPEQVQLLFDAALFNSQINLIGRDQDVQDFYRRLARTYPELLRTADVERLAEIFGISDLESRHPDDDIPF